MTIDISQVAIIEIVLGAMIGVLLVVVALQWAKLRAAARKAAEAERAEPEPVPPAAPARKLEQDLNFLVIPALPNILCENSNRVSTP